VSLCAATGRAGGCLVIDRKRGIKTATMARSSEPSSFCAFRAPPPLCDQPPSRPPSHHHQAPCHLGNLPMPGQASPASLARGIGAESRPMMPLSPRRDIRLSLSLSLSLLRDGATKFHGEESRSSRRVKPPPAGGEARVHARESLFLARRDARVTRDAHV